MGSKLGLIDTKFRNFVSIASAYLFFGMVDCYEFLPLQKEMSKTSSRDGFIAYNSEDMQDVVPRRNKKSLLNAEGSRRDSITGQIILTKEGGVEDVIKDLHKKLENLKANSNVKLRKISGQLKEDFDSLAQYVAWIYNTDSYPILYAEIQKYFGESDKYQPGTIGAYCGGCLVKEKGGFYTRGCSVICAGSIPPPYDDPEWDFCSDLVIWAVYSGDNFDFTTLNETEDNSDDKAIIFIEYNSLNAFPGFTEAEKKTLHDHGIDKVRLVYYNPNGNRSCHSVTDGNPMYIEVSNGFISLDQLKTRLTNLIPQPITNTNNGWCWWMILLVILILVAIFFFLCRCGSRADW